MPDDLYHRDFVAWTQAQADRLRRVAAGQRVNDLDWANVIEEIETLGRSEVQAVASLLEQALIHAMKLAVSPESTAAAHWRGELRTFLNNARRRFTPSMRQLLDLPGIHADALDAVVAMGVGAPGEVLAATTDLTLDELLAKDLGPDGLVARLRVG